MATTRFDPFRSMASLQEEMNRLFGDLYARRGEDDVMRRGTWTPPVDIFDTGQHEIVVKAELPDMRREDIQITVDNNTLTIHGEKKMDPALREEQFRRIERSYGPFSRSFALPPVVDPSRVTADYRAGVLTIRLPLREEAKPKQIQVQVSE